VAGDDPCLLPRARKNATEIEGARAAHLRDGVAMAEFLCWLEGSVQSGTLSEIDVVRKLEGFRANSPELLDISFPTICGSGPNGAIVHYHVTVETNRTITPGEVLLIDSGAQYRDGTTDITRTVATGKVAAAAARAFALVLKGVIAVSTARWPEGMTGHELDPMARRALWQAGLDYDHGTGHGVGSCLDVHEGPGGISRRTTAALEPGMILSIEPGYYEAGAFGIRTENLGLVLPAEVPAGGNRAMHGFETLTLCPIDRRMLPEAALSRAEAAWLDRYHARVRAALSPLLGPQARSWLDRACAPIPSSLISS
jgi:Xaa-Pro aminopeptidase